jgi:hypothetical protein
MTRLSHTWTKRVKFDIVQKSRLLDLPGGELYPQTPQQAIKWGSESPD